MIGKFALAVVAAAAVVAVPTMAQAQTANLRVMGCFQRNHDFIQAFLQKFVDPINAKNGIVKLTYVGGPEVTPINEQAPALRRGLVDMILCPAAYYGGLFGEARLPGAQNVSIAEIRRNGAWEMMEEAWAKNLNAHFLAWVYDDAQIFYTYYATKPKESTKTGLDLTGMKIRSTGLYNPFLLAMGATTIVMSPGDVYAGLQRGVVDGLAWPAGSISAYGWQRFLKYRVKPAFFNGSQPLLVNLDKWKGLTQEQRDFLIAQAKVLEAEGPAVIIQRANDEEVKLKAAGVEDIELTGDVRNAYLKTIYDTKWAQNDGLKFTVDYPKLKSLIYKPIGPRS